MLAEIFGVDGIVVVVVVAIVLLFGGSKLPMLARGLGSASHEFRKGMEEGEVGGPTAAAPAPALATVPAAVPATERADA
jgi:sec-independent protein translocase protein TatA